MLSSAQLNSAQTSTTIIIKETVPPREVAVTPTHFLPCKVKCTCDGESKFCNHPAKVDVYFDPVIRTTKSNKSVMKDGVMSLGERCSATFRGRPLQGVLMSVPEGFTGQILQECGRNPTDEVFGMYAEF